MSRKTMIALASMFALVLSTGFTFAQNKPLPLPVPMKKVPPKLPVPVDPMQPAPAPLPAPQSPRLGVKGFVAQNGGLKLTEVLPNFPAQDIGLEAGDTILTMDGSLIQSPTDVNTLLDQVIKTKNGKLEMVVQNGKDGKFFGVSANLVTQQFFSTQFGNGKNQGIAPQGRVKAMNVKITPIKK